MTVITRIVEKSQTISAPDWMECSERAPARRAKLARRVAEDALPQPPKEFTAAERALWLAELSQALDEAQKLASDLGLQHMQIPEAAELCSRLAAARAQVKGLRLSRADDAAEHQGSKWTNHPIWPRRDGGAV